MVNLDRATSQKCLDLQLTRAVDVERRPLLADYVNRTCAFLKEQLVYWNRMNVMHLHGTVRKNRNAIPRMHFVEAWNSNLSRFRAGGCPDSIWEYSSDNIQMFIR